MKTVFITINRGLLARNILRTDVLRILKSQPEMRIVVFVPKGAAPHFREEFKDEKNIIIEEVFPMGRTWFRKKVFQPLLKGLVFTNATRQLERFGTGFKPNKSIIRYCGYVLLFGFLSRFDSLKRLFHWLECKLYPDTEYEVFFDKYSPDLVFTTTVFSLADVAMNKVAKRRGVKSVGMAKSWDNLDKYFLQANPDKMLTQNGHLYYSAIKCQLFKPENVALVGFPQFDIYSDKSVLWGREEFCRKMGIAPDRKILLFGSQGPGAPDDEDVVDILHKFIMNNELIYPCDIIVRPHPLDVDQKRFEKFKSWPHVIVNDYACYNFFPDHWDPSREEMILFANILHHADVTINSFSTLSLDAACVDKPIINIAFDGYKNRPPGYSARDVYKRDHYREVLSKKATRLALSIEDLKNFINMYLKDPSVDSVGRVALRAYSSYADGKAGRRVAEFLLFEMGLKDITEGSSI